jgi:RNA polymerase sigma factor (sigma-70 family)
MTRVEEGQAAAVRASRADRSARTAALMSAARQGSDDAIGEIVTEFSPLMWHIARAAGLNPGDAEDVLQTVWMRMIEQLNSIRTPAALAGWLVTTTRREAWRVRAAERRHVPADQESFAEQPDDGPGAEEQVMIDEQRRTLWDTIRQLSPRCQELLRIIAFVPRPDYTAVAAALGMPIGSVGPTRGRCLAKLRVLLAAGAGEAAQ